MIYPSWYGLMYVLSFGVAFYLLPRLQKYRSIKLRIDDWLYLLALGVAGVMIGGRLGYAIFYEPTYFLNNPADIIAIWNGGMSSHGGFIGVTIALLIASRHLRIRLLSLLDIVVVPIALGLALGRFGNYINQELFVGQAALLAVAKDLLIAATCYWTLLNTKAVGRVAAVFLIMYSILRFLIEYIRIDEWEKIYGLTVGQFLTLPIFLVGLVILIISFKQKKQI